MTDLSIQRLDASEAGFLPALDQLIAWDMVSDSAVETTVTEILQQVRSRGDAALIEYSNRFDRRNCSSMMSFVCRQTSCSRLLNPSMLKLVRRWKLPQSVFATTTVISCSNPGSTRKRTAQCWDSR